MIGAIHPYAFRPYQWTPELAAAVARVRPFVQRNPYLPAVVQAEQLARFVGRDPDPVRRVSEALRLADDANEVCQLLASPLDQLALKMLALEFPTWGIVFDILPVAAQAICSEQTESQSLPKVIGIGALVAGAILIFSAFQQRQPGGDLAS